MIKCMFGGPTFAAKMIPVYRLAAEFRFEQVSLHIAQLEKCNENVVSIVCDGNRINQAFFRKFDTDPGKPWITQDRQDSSSV